MDELPNPSDLSLGKMKLKRREFLRALSQGSIGLLPFALLELAACTHPVAAPTQSPSPETFSVVSVSGTRLLVRQRNPDGSLASEKPYAIRGVNWSPASKTTDTSPDDPNGASVRRTEFSKWYSTDIPLMQQMNVNTVRVYIDMGTDNFETAVKPILDMLYRSGIMVILTVDDGVNDTDRLSQVVTLYKDHPALLMWLLGNEWNINLYFGVASSVVDAAQRTENAAKLVKSIDDHHPVATSYGDIDLNQTGLRLQDTQNYVNNLCPDVDIWSLNVFRGSMFGMLFQEWQSITGKPMYVGEFGSDAFHSTALNTSCPPGFIDQAAQASWDLSLWNDLLQNLSAKDASKVAAGGMVFEWNDEWWKLPPPGSQDTCGFPSSGDSDGFSNEDYFGILDIDRNPRQVYYVLQVALGTP